MSCGCTSQNRDLNCKIHGDRYYSPSSALGFARASDAARDRKRVRQLEIIKELKDYAQDAPRGMMPLVNELERLL